MSKQHYFQEFQLASTAIGQRLDQAIAEHCEDVSRSKLQDWIKKGLVSVDGQVMTKGRQKVVGGEQIRIDAEIEVAGEWEAQDIPLDIQYQDSHLLVINKPAGLVVHPAAGNRDGTLVNALLFFDENLRHLPRAGIVHRLDKDTSGLLVVARTLEAHTKLVEQLQQRAFEREYQCICHGQMVSGGTIEAPIGRHPTSRLQMAVVPNGKEAITHYRLRDKFNNFTHLKVNLETGRTHQIRVHMAYLKYPLVGDALYGKHNFIPSGSSDELKEAIRGFRRQALHARKLGLEHPVSGEFLHWEVEAPADYQHLLSVIEQENGRV
ncbi:23S rRNA pseudouridine(1911/1915/1917) synthase RluD [Pleionea litopenaei]|uniref:Pseudouridine synthase n=1 Tax=Pleionea litopenaei TaxID=3070815 RepID=A0AA51X7J0_9GAMM|nr:23S rRNA pseudouridine(1911/1915/1917) synthase RluD [Pleionea sp. HL-JVS1]WMS88372.1 23S rRNA pseudouridine(1911/1915/1917) synthase RluD [Pleionea sp. HL-JVS1]